MSDDHKTDYDQLKKQINAVGIVLIVGTALTFAADLFHVADHLGGFGYAVLMAMFVAIIKATGVVAVFMHIWWDSKLKTISWTMLCTFFFFAGMMGLTVLGEQWRKPGNIHEFDANTGLPITKESKDASENGQLGDKGDE
ncbi:MAG: hypothetical protein CMO66_00190 [Verrucomicrobiales bacterium]|nr:hypothetical protein [Verrucomicrobiales bacterium]